MNLLTTLGLSLAAIVISNAAAQQPGSGTYSGLFLSTNTIANGNSGAITLTVTAVGTYSGRLQFGGGSIPLRGNFNNGSATQIIPLRDSSNLELDLQANGNDSLTGTVSTGLWGANFVAHRGGYDGRMKIASQAGRYTLVLPGNPGSSTLPGGDSYATVTVDTAGRIKLSASLSDGTKISQAALLSTNGDWAFYVPLYGSKGSIFGWLNVAPSTETQLGGDVNWFRPSMPTGKFYAGGFTNTVAVVGSTYVPPAKGASVLPFLSAEADLVGGNLQIPVTNRALLDPQFGFKNLSSSKFTIQFVPTTGGFRGSAVNPVSGKPISFSGVILQTQNGAAGLFPGTNQFGQVRLHAVDADVVDFQTIGTAFSPEVYVDYPLMQDFRWAWSDNTISTNFPLTSKLLRTRASRHQYLSAYPPGVLTSINIGFDGSDGGENTPLTNRPQQNVSSVNFPYPLPTLKYWASSYNPITNTLDFTGFAALEAVECFHCSNLQHVVVANLPSLKRLCFESCNLQEFNLTGMTNLADVRAALNGFTTVTIDAGTGPNIWHWCTRDNPQLTQNLHESMTNFYSLQEFWAWRANQSGALTFASTNLTDVELFGNHYESADFSNQTNLQILQIDNNSLTNLVLTGSTGLVHLEAQQNQLTSQALDDILAALDACPNLDFADLTHNAEFPSAVGYMHYDNIHTRTPMIFVDGR